MTEAKSPKTMAPIKKLIPKIKESATPGKTACEMASPIKDMPLRIMKQPTAPATIPMTMAVISAFCRKWKFCSQSINSENILKTSIHKKLRAIGFFQVFFCES